MVGQGHLVQQEAGWHRCFARPICASYDKLGEVSPHLGGKLGNSSILEEGASSAVLVQEKHKDRTFNSNHLQQPPDNPQH